MFARILDKISFRENKRRFRNLKGVASRYYAYKGPDAIQIDLTNRCNSKCLLCWTHSPLIQKDKNSNSEDLDFSIVKNFINDIAELGTKEVIFSGGGEPFVYPKIWEVLEFTQEAGLRFHINSNLTLLDRRDISRLLSFNNLSSLTISIWAGDAALYSRLHNRKEEVFYRVKDTLKILNASKSSRLHTKICTIVNRLNYSKLRDLLDLSAETGCNAIEFGVADTIAGATGIFLLDKTQLNSLKQDYVNITRSINNKSRVKIINEDLFLRRISNGRACYGEYDSFLEKMPCYAGWLFLRLRANGDYNSCLKSHRLPIGNIYKDRFSSVWNNLLQQDFRRNSLAVPKNREYLRFIGNSNDGDIGCRRLCDNILMNRQLLCRIARHLF